MHPSFTIYSDNNSSGQQQLFVYAGRQGILFITLDASGKMFKDIVSYHFPQAITDERLGEQLKEIFAEEQLMRQLYKKIDIIYLFPENILTPHEVYGNMPANEMLDIVFGDAGEYYVRTDFVYRHNLHNVYRVPTVISAAIEAQFPVANHTHDNSLLADALKGDGLFALFYPHAVTVLLRDKGQLQVLQTFNYTTAEDAAYHLLNVCRSFGAAVDEVTLFLYGMIDKDSALFIELYKYFMNVEFAALPAAFSYPAALNEHPEHYFSHLFATAACV